MDNNDRMISCRTCGKEFIFTVREQEFFTSKGFDEPRHCPDCRAQRKREKMASGGATPESSPQPQPHSGGKEWSEVVCASCGKPTSVPFRPTTGRPVFCRECFAAQRTGEMAKSRPPAGETFHKPVVPKPTNIETKPPVIEIPQHILEDDMGPLPEVDPAPDEEGEITTAEFLPMGGSFGATPEEIEPEFGDNPPSKPV